MFTAQIVVVANTEAEMITRLNDITGQIEKGYSSGSAVAKVESFKFLVKESLTGGKVALPRLPENAEEATAGADTETDTDLDTDQEEQENDEAGVAPLGAIPSFVNSKAE